jgi:predicted nucleic acid-binding protein
MRLPNSAPDPVAVLVADTSFWINLAATTDPADILRALPAPVILAEAALEDLRRGQARGWQSVAVVETLLAAGHTRVEALPPSALPAFAGLVAGEAADTLDDGEAATLALAHASGGIAIVDERKARRLAATRFPALPLKYTVELLLSPSVAGLLGPLRVSDALFAALTVARMNVPAEMIAGVVGLIGADRAQLCPSLPLRSRMPMAINAGARAGRTSNDTNLR